MHKPSLSFSYHLSRSAAVKPCIADVSQKSIRSSLAKIKSFALCYTGFQVQFHCRKNDRRGKNTPSYQGGCSLK